ncbi:hypothetical protein ACV07N_16100 [Roseivirga echinicomitans]
MNRTIILNIISLFAFTGCTYKKNPDIIIVNESSTVFENVFIHSVHSSDSTNLGSLGVGERLKGSFVNTDPNPTDGCYVVRAVSRSGRQVYKCIGYYTNGSSLNRGFQLTIKNDTSITKEW